MKRFATVIVGLALAVSAMAEASFDQIEHLIEQRNYAAAASGLEVIIQNHPKSAKAFYAMAQAQAGLGNLEKAQKALNIATGLNPTLDFAPQSSVQSLKDAITPQVSKIEAVEESHFWRNTFLLLLVLEGGIAGMVFAANRKRKEDEETAKSDVARREALEEYIRQVREREAKVSKANAAPINHAPATASIATSGPAVPQPTYTPPTHTTVVNNTSSNDGFLTGLLVGNMLGDHHHDTTRVVEREVIREVPSYTPTPTQSVRDSSWDDTPSTPSRSSSWDSDSSSSSSSWSSSSSDSSSSSSWDSGSSSSDSGSSSSWD